MYKAGKAKEGPLTNKYKHITFGYPEFDRSYDPPKIKYLCYNSADEDLGVVEWYAPWNQYVYRDTSNAIYSQSCLVDIDDFLSQLNPKPRRDH